MDVVIPAGEAATAFKPPIGLGKRARSVGVTMRSVALGIVFTALVDLWIHWAELVMGGGQGHSAVAATSTPVGAVTVLFMLAGINQILRFSIPRQALTGAELLVVYSMIATSSTLSSSGQLHFIIPTVTAAYHYANDANGWSGTFFRFVPHWMAQTNPTVLDGFYTGKTTPPWGLWMPQMVTWIGFLCALSFASLCLVSLLRRQWVDRERLSFPTVALPLELMEPDVPLFRRPLFWIAAAIPFGFACMNTLALNVPRIPLISLRADINIASLMTQPPWNDMGPTYLSIYPFVLGIAYLVPVDVAFSSWFFFLVTRAENIVGAALNIDSGMTDSSRATFPFIGQQGAGAFLALTFVSLWLSRKYLKDIWTTAFGGIKVIDDSEEPISYRAAFIGLIAASLVTVGVCVAGGMQPVIAVTLVFLARSYIIAGTRIRAETGNAWLWGPDADVNQLMTHTFGSSLLNPHDLTILAYMRPVLGNSDMRCLAMPHQFDAMKMADAVGASRRRLFGAICFGTVVGVTISFMIALTVWHGFGAEAKTDAWRTSMGRIPFDSLVATLHNPLRPDGRGTGAILFGFLVTAALMGLRSYFVWWPLHPVGYVLANTNTMPTVWLPFMVAWLIKVLILRYGGHKLFRQSLPFFLGLIAGDLLDGGLTTLLGAFTGINVYPINW